MLNWIKTHKLLTLLILIIAYLLFYSKRNTITPMNMMYGVGTDVNTVYSDRAATSGMIGVVPPSNMGFGMMEKTAIVSDQAVPMMGKTGDGRMVDREAYLSLLVKNVNESVAEILRITQIMQGYMINSNVSNPDNASTGSITIRIPTETLDSTLAKIKALGVKVVSENLNGTDITDQFQDVQARLKPLRETYDELDALRSQTSKVEEKMNILMQLQSLQAQIDTLVGQEKYLADSARTSKITIYLSTDEYELPYTPNDNWRVGVVFKQAVRDLIMSLRSVISSVIYYAVYGVIWIPILLVVYIIYRKMRKSPPRTGMN